MPNSHECKGVNRQALQLCTVHKKPYLLLQVISEFVSGTTSHTRICIRYYNHMCCICSECNYSVKRCGDRALYITFTFVSSLPCLHTFWHAIPTPFYISIVFIFLFLYRKLPKIRPPLFAHYF